MTTPKTIPPVLADMINAVGRIGYRAISAGVAEALRGVGEFTKEMDARVQKGARAASKMASTGQPYEPEETEEDDDAER